MGFRITYWKNKVDIGLPGAESRLIGKDPDAGKDWRQEEKGTTEAEMVGRHPRLDGHEFEWTPGVGDGQGGLTCCSPWVKLYTTEQLNNNNKNSLFKNQKIGNKPAKN